MLLPEDIILLVISKLPIKDILRCKCLSKSLNSSISHPSFATSIQNSNTGILLHQIFYRLNFCISKLLYFDAENPNQTDVPPVSYLVTEDARLQNVLVGSCKGLLCFSSFMASDFPDIQQVDVESVNPPKTPVFIYNPLTNEQIYLPGFSLSYHELPYVVNTVSGFGFDTLENVFKVVMVLFYRVNGKPIKKEILIHTLGTNTWRRGVCQVPDELEWAYKSNSTALVNGSLHWFIDRRHQDINRAHVVSFNLGTEEFGHIVPPEQFWSAKVSHYGITSDPLGEMEGCLSITGMVEAYNIEVWIMKNYNIKESWSKVYHISHAFMRQMQCDLEFIMPLCIPLKGIMLLNCNNKFLMLYNIKSNQFISAIEFIGDTPESRYDRIRTTFPFVGSLISPMQLVEKSVC